MMVTLLHYAGILPTRLRALTGGTRRAITPTMTNTNVKSVAQTMGTCDLLHVARTLNAEVEGAMLAGVTGTQAHMGMIELAQACGPELVARGYVGGVPADGSNLPVLVQWEDGVVKLSRPVLVF